LSAAAGYRGNVIAASFMGRAMMDFAELRIGNKKYYKTSSYVFEMTYKGLNNLRFNVVPYYSSIE
jgi:hypothetical protein